jgi:hypothetical protein
VQTEPRLQGNFMVHVTRVPQVSILRPGILDYFHYNCRVKYVILTRERSEGEESLHLLFSEYHVDGRLYASAPWHFLNFLPEPHGQGSLRPTFSPVRRWAV